MARNKTRRLLLVRHGETDWNAEGRIQGMLDVPLNALGMAQARIVGDALARSIDIAFDPRIRERHFGVLEGRTYAEWRAVDAAGMARYDAGDPDYGPEGGETARGFLDRCVAAITDMVTACHEKTLILVTHGGVVSSMYRHSQGLGFHSERTWGVPNASISEWRVEYHGDGGAPAYYCERIGDDTHLEENALDEVDK